MNSHGITHIHNYQQDARDAPEVAAASPAAAAHRHPSKAMTTVVTANPSTVPVTGGWMTRVVPQISTSSAAVATAIEAASNHRLPTSPKRL
jgi:hypothetical protein